MTFYKRTARGFRASVWLLGLVALFAVCLLMAALRLPVLPDRSFPLPFALCFTTLVLLFAASALALHARRQRRQIATLQAARQTQDALYLSTLTALASAIDAKDQDAPAHLPRLRRSVEAVAQRLGLLPAERNALGIAALLHDVGKLGVPDYVLSKPAALTAPEFEKIKRHTLVGAAILEPIAFPGPVAAIVRHHHEQWNGGGYPDGLTGAAIPQGARILALCDTYDALISPRAYRPAWSLAQAREFLQIQSGVQFDPEVVTAFLEIVAGLDAENAASPTLPAAPASDQAIVHIRRSASELWALYEVAQVMKPMLEQDERLRQLGGKIVSFLPGCSCVFVLNRAFSGLAEGGATPAPGGEDWRVEAAVGPHAEAVNGLTPANGEAGAMREAWNRNSANALALLTAPLTHQGETFGAMHLLHERAEAFSEEDAFLLNMIAEQAQSVLYQDILLRRTRSDALTDSLTGLYNVRYLRQAVARLLEGLADTDENCVLLYLDMDNFKPINDRYGHQAGDKVLRDMAELFQRGLRPGDLVVRCGGDEFMVILPQTTETAAQRVASRIQRAVAGYRLTDAGEGDQPRLGVSIGIACCPRDGLDINALGAIADQRMYQEKEKRKAARPRSAPVSMQGN